MRIIEDDLTGPEIRELLRAHLEDMIRISPRESVHALDIDGLRAPDITFFTAWEGQELLGCGALKALDSKHGEVKSMRTAERFRGRGVASRLLQHIVEEAKGRSYQRLSLETGSKDAFAPARLLYARFGFVPCRPFAGYPPHPHSAFMTLDLLSRGEARQPE